MSRLARTSRPSRRRSPCAPGRRSTTALVAALLVAAACGESSPQGPAVEAGGPASVAVTATIEAAGGGPASQQSGGGLGAAFDVADVASVRVTGPGGSVLADREVAFDPGAGGAELRLELTIEDDRVPANLQLALRRGADRLFEGSTGLTLVAGETATAELGLDPVAAAVSVPAGPVTFTALGDSARLEGAVVFATGDTIPGLSPTWTSGDSAIADVTPEGTVVADAPGETEAIARHEDLTASVAVEVDPEVATVALEPDATTFTGLGQSRDFSVRVTDANGNPVTDEPVTWSSTDVQVASVDGSGLVVSRGDGAALVVAEAMGTADTAAVTVDLGPTGRVSGQVGRVQPPASSSAVAASASASGGGVGTAITTSPAGGVEVRFVQGSEVVSRTTTAADGSWTSPAIPPGTYTLEYASADLVTVRHEGVEVGDGTTGSVADVPMVPASDQPGTMEGLVSDVRTGGGVAGAAVEVHRGLEAPEGPVVATGTTGADGRYSIEGVEPGTYTITASAPDFAPDEITGVALGGEIFGGQDLALVPPPEVTIGAPADGASFTTDDVIPFRGSADDPEQGSLGGDALVWTSDQLTDPIGTGESLTATLPAGEHTITLTATNERGASSSASIGITVEEVQEPLEPQEPVPVAPARAYVANLSTDDVSVIDVATNQVVATIPVGNGPLGARVTPDGSIVYIVNARDGTISVIDVATNTVTGTITVGTEPRDAAFTPDGSTAYVSNSGSNDVSVVDVTSGTVTATFPVGTEPWGIVVDPDGTRAYVANQSSNDVSVIDLATNQVVRTLPVGSGPLDVATTPTGARAYVANLSTDDVSVIDLATDQVVATIPVGNRPLGLAVTPDGSEVYTANATSNDVSVIDVATNTVVATIPAGIDPTEVAFTSDGSLAYVTNFDSNDVTVIDVATRTVVATVPVGDTPRDVTVTP